MSKLFVVLCDEIPGNQIITGFPLVFDNRTQCHYILGKPSLPIIINPDFKQFRLPNYGNLLTVLSAEVSSAILTDQSFKPNSNISYWSNPDFFSNTDKYPALLLKPQLTITPGAIVVLISSRTFSDMVLKNEPDSKATELIRSQHQFESFRDGTKTNCVSVVHTRGQHCSINYKLSGSHKTNTLIASNGYMIHG